MGKKSIKLEVDESPHAISRELTGLHQKDKTAIDPTNCPTCANQWADKLP